MGPVAYANVPLLLFFFLFFFLRRGAVCYRPLSMCLSAEDDDLGECRSVSSIEPEAADVEEKSLIADAGP